MNTKILQKILEELNKETPSIDYLKGMVETLIEMSGLPSHTHGTITKTPIVRTEMVSDETTEPIPEHLRVGPVARI